MTVLTTCSHKHSLMRKPTEILTHATSNDKKPTYTLTKNTALHLFRHNPHQIPRVSRLDYDKAALPTN